jgi:hypothetical protein
MGERYTSVEITEASERIPNTGWYVKDEEADGDHEASLLIDGPYEDEADCNTQRDKLIENLPKE